MGFALPSGVVNTDSVYFYAADAATLFGPYVKDPSDQTLVVVDYSQLTSVVILTSFTFAMDVSSNPKLVVAYPLIDSTGTLLSFLLSGGLEGQQYTITINVQYLLPGNVSGARSDTLTVSIPTAGDCAPINPVPALYSQAPLWGGGYINSAVRLFWGNVPPSNPNALDQWFNMTTQVLSEWMTDGQTASWVIISGLAVLEAPLDGVLYSRSNHAWVPTPIQVDAPDATLQGRKAGAWAHITHSDITDWSTAIPAPYVLPIASTTVLGGVKVDGSTIAVSGSGVISVPALGAPVTIAASPPVSPIVGSLWFDNVGAALYLYYDDGTSRQWIPVVNQVSAGGSAPALAPGNTVLPVISGTTTVGSTLTTTNGTWTGSPTSYSYQWLRNSVAISGAIASTYVLTGADTSMAISCQVTATNSTGSTPANSNVLSIPAIAPVNTALPTISGVGVVGNNLSCSTGVWNNTPTGFTYQWKRGGANISGATSSSYTLVVADATTSITCAVTASNAAGNATATTNPLTIAAVVPVNLAVPTLSGVAGVGQPLTCNVGSWSNSPTSYSYAWLRDGTVSIGTNSPNYTTVSGDGTHTITCTVIATNSFGSSAPATSAGLAIGIAPVNTVAPVATLGSTSVSTTNGTWNNSPTGFTYQWLRGGVNISGATASTYTLVLADANTSLSCAVTASNVSGSATTASNTVAVGALIPVNTAAPAVTPSGTQPSGTALTCAPGTWGGSPTFAYQWLRGGSTSIGTNSPNYTTVSGDIGSSVTCTVTATNTYGNASAVSNAVAVIAAVFTFPGAPIGLYSLRKVGSGYAGQCLRVQRSSDNTRQDIGFDANGNVNMSAITAFCAGSQAFVFTWYDQSGNARDLIYGNGALPQINMIGSRPWICFYNQAGSAGAQTLFTAAAPNLTADMTVGFVGQLGTDYCCMPINQWNGSNGWFTTFNGAGNSGQVGVTPGIFQAFSTGGGGVALPDTGRYFARTNRYVAKRSGSTGTLYVNGATTKTGGLPASLTTTSPFAIGGDATTGFPFTGLIGEVYVYSSAISDTDRNSIDGNQAAAFPDTGFSTPYSGTSCVQFDWQEQISCGAVLTYDRNASWTAFSAVQLFFFPLQATVIYTNVLTQPWFGHELWVDNFGRVRVRLMGNWDGVIGHAGMAAVIGTTNVIDGKKHMLAYSYNGSSTAAGIKVYIDGLPETTTVESDTLAASMVGGTQNLIVGNQAGTVFDLTGTLSHFQIDNVARSAAYIANYTPASGTKIPPIDANTDLCLLLNDGSGTTATDSSGHGRNGTLNSASLWVV